MTEPAPFFVLQPEHAANRMDGCLAEPAVGGAMRFQFSRGGPHILILKAGVPLRIAEQRGLTARLRPGWDGSLGYSLYALEVESAGPGEGRVRLEVRPAAGDPFNPAFMNRASKFPCSPELFLKWAQQERGKLATRLMNGGLPKRVPLSPEVLETEERESYVLRRVKVRTQADRWNTLLVSMPRKAEGRVPLLVALHGHEAGWGTADAAAFTTGHVDDFCAFFAERGWAVVQPATMDHTLQHEGWTLQGEWAWDAMVALDFAVGLPGVDAGRVAVCGLSTGAHLAMNLLALDDRVRAGVVGCILSTWHHYRERMRIPPHCDCGILDQLGGQLEICDWAALAAPKPVQFQHGRQDAAFCPGANVARLEAGWNTAVMPEDEFAAAWAEVERAYRLTGAPAGVALHIHEAAHRVDTSAAYEFLRKRI